MDGCILDTRPGVRLNERQEPGGREGTRAAVGLAIAGAPILALLAAQPHGVTLPRGMYLPAHTILEALVVASALATFGVQWFAAGTGAFLEARARFIGPAFLGAAIFTLLHLLTFPGMPGFFGASSTDRGIFYWFPARLLATGALLLAARIGRGSRSPVLGRRRLLLAANLAVVAAFVAAELATSDRAPLFFVEGRGLTLLKARLELLLVVACAVGALLHLRAWRVTREPAAGKLAVALVLAVYAELCLSLYVNAYDPFNLAGHVYLVASFWFVFDALFVAALVRPYQDLAALRSHVEGELVVTIQRLREATEQREDLLRAVSHDLRNPLQIVVLQAQRLLAIAQEERPRRGAAGILVAARRMDRMLRDLADSARSDSGRLDLELAPVRLRSFVTQLLEGSDGVLDGSRVDVAVPDELPDVHADPDRLDRILVNLVGNALKYSRGRVRILGERVGEEVRVAVEDGGPGIATADLPRIFERYYRGQRHEGEGLGLGLFIVRKLVEAHAGRVGVESRPGEGSTFSFWLPVTPAALRDEAAVAASGGSHSRP
jgi:signal transduction histidine kinase